MLSPHIQVFMSTKLDIKSALIGLSAGVLITLGIGAAASPGSVGRYQVAGTANQGLIVDTATGQVWRAYFHSNNGNTDGDFFSPKIGDKK